MEHGLLNQMWVSFLTFTRVWVGSCVLTESRINNPVKMQNILMFTL